jgi:predicted outer membrane repeat protein
MLSFVPAALAAFALLALPSVAFADDPEPIVVHTCDTATFTDAVISAPAGATIQFGCDGTIPFDDGTYELDLDVTIDGNGHDVTLDGLDQDRLFVVDGGVTATLRDLTVTRGYAPMLPEALTALGGGAILNFGTLVTDHVDFEANRADGTGGAIASTSNFSVLTVRHSRFAGNSARTAVPGSYDGGGAIAVKSKGATTIDDSVFVGNTATGTASGGAVLGVFTNRNVNDGPITITHSRFEGNRLNMGTLNDDFPGGGAVAVFNHSLDISGSTFSDNRVSAIIQGDMALGGALMVAGGRLDLGHDARVTDTTFDGNQAGDPGHFGRGGAINVQAGERLALERVTLSGNRALYGNALGTVADVTVADSRFVDNLDEACWTTAASRVIDGGGNSEAPGTSCGFPVPAPPAPAAPVTPPAAAPVVAPDTLAPSAPDPVPNAWTAPDPMPTPIQRAAAALGAAATPVYGLGRTGAQLFTAGSVPRALRPGQRLRVAIVCTTEPCTVRLSAIVRFTTHGKARTLRLPARTTTQDGIRIVTFTLTRRLPGARLQLRATA